MSHFVYNYRMDHPDQSNMSHIGYMIFDTQLDRQLTQWPYFKSCCKLLAN